MIYVDAIKATAKQYYSLGIHLQSYMANVFYKVCNVGQANHIGAEFEGNGCIPDKSTFTNLIIGHCLKKRMHSVGQCIIWYPILSFLFCKTCIYAMAYHIFTLFMLHLDIIV